MKWTPYARYSPTGVEWVSETPSHWSVMRLGHVTRKVGSGKTPKGGAETYQSEGVLLIRSQNVHDADLRLADAAFISDETDSEMSGTRVHPGDVLLNITGASLGRCAIAPAGLPPANVNQHVCIVRIRADQMDARFVQRWLSSRPAQEQISSFENGSSREGLNFQQVRSLCLTCPPIDEQQVIVDFLDEQTAKVDSLLAKKRTLIERLKVKRAALITQMVTRGLPPEVARVAGLDSHPKLKPSGVEYLSDVPGHWAVKPFRRIIMQLDQGWSPTADYAPAEDDQWGVLKLSAIRSGRFDPSENKALDEIPAGIKVVSPRRDDLLISRANTPERVGDACTVHDNFARLIVPDLIYRIRLRSSAAMARFVCYFLLSHIGRACIEADARGSNGSMVKLGQEHIRTWPIPVPPLSEQAIIADYLDRETIKLDKMAAKVEAAIERLQEYRTALITAAVTGKIDVRPAEGKIAVGA